VRLSGDRRPASWSSSGVMVVVRRHGRCPPSRPCVSTGGVVRRHGRRSAFRPCVSTGTVIRRSGRRSVIGVV
jgi:hypothetical protein